MRLLPIEIWENIFNEVPLPRKLECMLVCKQWEEIVRLYSLLNTLVIDNQKKFNAIRPVLATQPWRGAQVRRLILVECFIEDMDKGKLYALFPNLQVLYLERTRELHRRTYRITLAMRNSLKHVYDNEGRFEFTHNLLSSGLCKGLNKIDVTVPSNDRSCTKLVSLLVNAPRLTYLRIENGDISIYDLEILHMNAPLLEQLLLANENFIMNDDLPEEIIPAESLTSLEMAIFEVNEVSQIKWLYYIREKYINLTEFRYCHYADHRDYVLERLNKVGYFPLIHCLGPQLKSIFISPIQMDSNIFKTFDKYGCRLQKVALVPKLTKEIQNLAQSNQTRYIQNLNLVTIDPFPVITLSRFPVLKELRLDYRVKGVSPEGELSYYNIHFIDMINHLPSKIESLDLRNAHIELRGLTREISSLKNLTLIGCELDVGLDTVISLHMPNLNSLQLYGYDPPELDLDLSLHHMLYLGLRPNNLTFDEFRNLVSIKTLDDQRMVVYNAKRHYGLWNSVLLDSGNPSTYDAIPAIPFKKRTRPSLVNIVCGSLKKLVINDRPCC